MAVTQIYYPCRVKTETSFTADDPWNQNRRATFALDNYVLAPRGAHPLPDARPAVYYLRGIRSSLDNVERMLPESMSELWCAKRIPPESLPSLLKEMQPTPKGSDYEQLLRNKNLLAFVWIAWIFTALFCTMPFLNLNALVFEPTANSLPIALVVASVCLLILYAAFYRGRWRRASQTKWVLARLEAVESAPLENTITMTKDTPLKFDIDRQDGTIRLPNGFAIGAALTKDAFQASAVFAAARRLDSSGMPWTEYRFPAGDIDGKNISATVTFSSQLVLSVNLTADLYPPGPKSWDTYSDKTEAATKDFHDRLLQYVFADSVRGEQFHVERLSEDETILARPLNWPFPWGSVDSTHDPRGCETYITVSYGNRYAEAVKALQAANAQAKSSGARSRFVQSVANDSDFAAALEPAKQALAHGNKIDAIRLARQATAMSLGEAQELIALWEKKT